MEDRYVYSSSHDVDVSTKLSMNILCYNNTLYDVLNNETLVSTVVEIDDKSFTVVCDSELISNVETLLDIESNRIEYKVIRNNKHTNSLKVRSNSKILKTINKDEIISIKQLYIANIKPPKGNGILFLVSDKITISKNNEDNQLSSPGNVTYKNSLIQIDTELNFDPKDLQESIYVARMHWYTDRTVDENLHNTIHIAIKNLDIETIVDMLEYKGFDGRYVYDITKDDFYMIKYAIASSTEEVVIWLLSRVQDNKLICPDNMILDYLGDNYQLLVEFIERVKYFIEPQDVEMYVSEGFKRGCLPI